MNYKELSKYEKLAELQDIHFCKVERPNVAKYLYALWKEDKVTIDHYESFGDTLHKFLMNKRSYDQQQLFGFTQKEFNEHGWLERPQFLDIEEFDFPHRELDHIKTFFERNLDFYKYYRTGWTHSDKYYFVRGKPDIQLNLDSFYFERDPLFSTCFDFKITKILANEMLAIYLNEELTKLESYPSQSKTKDLDAPRVKLTWTG